MNRNSKADRYTIFIPIVSTPSDCWPEYEPFTDEEIAAIDKDAARRIYKRVTSEFPCSTIRITNAGKRLTAGQEIRVISNDSLDHWMLTIGIRQIVVDEEKAAAWDVLGERDQSTVQ